MKSLYATLLEKRYISESTYTREQAIEKALELREKTRRSEFSRFLTDTQNDDLIMSMDSLLKSIVTSIYETDYILVIEDISRLARFVVDLALLQMTIDDDMLESTCQEYTTYILAKKPFVDDVKASVKEHGRIAPFIGDIGDVHDAEGDTSFDDASMPTDARI